MLSSSLLRRFPRPRSAHLLGNQSRSLASSSTLPSSPSTSTNSRPSNLVRVVEVGPRDGLQNEKSTIPVKVKVELINRLARAGLKTIEAGSFVSPRWVPQMAGTAEVIAHMERLPGVHYPVLVPNARGLDDLLALLSEHKTTSPSPTPPPTDEIAIFTAATDAFNRANTNTTIAESLTRLTHVASRAITQGLRVRGYISVVITCPYSGKVDYKVVRDVAKRLLEMGCYEVSLGDTNGTGTPESVREMLEEVLKDVPAEKLAGHYHDTYGAAVPNLLTSLSLGLRTFDSSIAGLGGCPYSPGATGNVATEDVLHVLTAPESGYVVEGQEQGLDLRSLVETGEWVSQVLGRRNESKAGRAYAAKWRREKEEKQKSRL